MFRTAMLALASTVALTAAAPALEVINQSVRPPQAGTADRDIPAWYSPNGVNNLRMVSNAGIDGDGNRVFGMVWRWNDDNGKQFKLSRRLVQVPGRLGNLGDYTLQTTSAPRVVPAQPDNGGRLPVPPSGMSNTDIPAFYSPNGVNGLTMISSIARLPNGERTETTWKWTDDAGIGHTLYRTRNDYRNGSTSTSYRLEKVG